MDARQDKRLFDTLTLFALMIRCPFQLERKRSCPFYEFRELADLERKFALAEKLASENGAELLAAHDVCKAELLERNDFSSVGALRPSWILRDG